MKLIVGLGNPGEKYQYNRHNVGFMVVDKLVQSLKSKVESRDLTFKVNKKFNADVVMTKEYILVKPQTFMNDSGIAVAAICNFYKIKNEDLYIIHDDLDIKIGNYKIQHGKGPKVHNGLKSVEEKLGTEKFWNVRVGVENREVRGNSGIPGVVYSLQNFSPDERTIIEGVISDTTRELFNILQGPTL
jgi:PTH1 family peptidyl-tRNA hydrolase